MHYVILAITLLGTLLGQLLTRTVSIVFEVMAKRALVIGAVLLVLATFVTSFYLLINSTINAISSVAPPYLSQAASLFIPDNLPALISLQITARVARWVYEWNVKVLQWRL